MLGLDIGDRRIGVALSDPGRIIATPLAVIEYHSEAEAVRAILDILGKNAVELIIAGLPRSMDGTIGRQAEKVQAFVGNLAAQTKVPLEYRDERLSSISARRVMGITGKGGSKIGEDAVAAAVILQAYLDETMPDFPEPE